MSGFGLGRPLVFGVLVAAMASGTAENGLAIDAETARKVLLRKHLEVEHTENSRPEGEMTEDEQLEVILRRVSLYFSQRRFAEAAEKLKEAEALRPDAPAVLEAKVGILAESGRIDEARTVLQRLLEREPNRFAYRYNKAELYMMEKRYGEARQCFEALREAHSDNDLVAFKIFLTYLGEKNEEKMMEWAHRLKRPQVTPYMYYTAAVLAFAEGDIPTGKRAILEAEQAFGRGKQKLLYHSLAEMGWVVRDAYPPQ